MFLGSTLADTTLPGRRQETPAATLAVYLVDRSLEARGSAFKLSGPLLCIPSVTGIMMPDMPAARASAEPIRLPDSEQPKPPSPRPSPSRQSEQLAGWLLQAARLLHLLCCTTLTDGGSRLASKRVRVIVHEHRPHEGPCLPVATRLELAKGPSPAREVGH